MSGAAKDPNFGYGTPDSSGCVPDFALLGTRLRHTGNNKVYTVRGFAWMGADDLWGFIHKCDGGPMLCRPLSHIEGNRNDGSRRYERVLP